MAFLFLSLVVIIAAYFGWQEYQNERVIQAVYARYK